MQFQDLVRLRQGHRVIYYKDGSIKVVNLYLFGIKGGCLPESAHEICEKAKISTKSAVG